MQAPRPCPDALRRGRLAERRRRRQAGEGASGRLHPLSRARRQGRIPGDRFHRPGPVERERHKAFYRNGLRALQGGGWRRVRQNHPGDLHRRTLLAALAAAGMDSGSERLARHAEKAARQRFRYDPPAALPGGGNAGGARGAPPVHRCLYPADGEKLLRSAGEMEPGESPLLRRPLRPGGLFLPRRRLQQSDQSARPDGCARRRRHLAADLPRRRNRPLCPLRPGGGDSQQTARSALRVLSGLRLLPDFPGDALCVQLSFDQRDQSSAADALSVQRPGDAQSGVQHRFFAVHSGLAGAPGAQRILELGGRFQHRRAGAGGLGAGEDGGVRRGTSARLDLPQARL